MGQLHSHTYIPHCFERELSEFPIHIKKIQYYLQP